MSEMFGGALVSEGLRGLIEEAKKFKNFKPLSEDLVSNMERLIPLTEEIDSSQNALNLDVEELKGLKETMERAKIVVRECRGVWWFKRSKLTREIEQVNKEMLNFCQIDVQILLLRNQLKSTEANNNNFETIIKKIDNLSVQAPVYTDYCSVPKPVNVLVGFDCPLMELKKKILDVSVVNLVVTAPPGCGKTTLVNQLCHDKEVKGKFKHIFYSVVSSNPNLRVIVQHLLQHNGYKDLTFDNNSQAANGLRKLLEELKRNELEGNDILLVLDDVWRGAELFLKNFQIDLQGYKILVTSRFEFPSFGPTYHLKPLENKDAKNLLIQFASPLPHHTNSDEFEDLLKKILKRCSGFPLVIEVVGTSLKGQDLYLWKGQVESWSEGEKIIDSSSVLERLQPSFSALKPQLKECFMDMGSFLEDQQIHASLIIDIWAELYGKGTSSSIVYLNELASQNLLKLIPWVDEHEDGFDNKLRVTQHDILRELAIHQSELEAILERKRLNLEIREDRFPGWCLNGPRHPIINASLLSISTDDLFSSIWVEMDCPNVEALILNLSSSDYALPSFIAGMTKLKVLIITNHVSYPAARLRNFKCLSSLPNLKRIRLEKVSITLLDLPQLRLGSLEKLSFYMCSFIDDFYYCVDIDISEALPSLQEIDGNSGYSHTESLNSRNQLQSTEASNNNFETINKKLDNLGVQAPVFRHLCSVPELKKVPVGFDLPLMELKEKLLDVSVVNIVVSAPPGCGKSTLVTQLCHDKEVKEKFEHIFFCVVSSTPNFRGMVQDLLQDNGYQALTFNNDSQAANGLRELLEKLKGKRILLVLDDVWAGSESFLEKFPTDIPNLKILVTSRSRSLDFGYSYHLEPLNDEYAETLLVQYASRPDHASPAVYKDLLQKILKRCNGFPLVIKVVGASLKNRSLNYWQGQVVSWSKGNTVLDNPRPEVIDCLQPSFDALDPDLKQCFLDMGLFLEDQKISAWILIDIWVELYGNGIPTKKRKILCMKYLEDLAAQNLLDLVPHGGKEHEDGFYDEFLVTQHDILRELAIRQSKSEVERKRLNLEIREDKFPDWCLNGPTHPIINASMLSISTDDLFSSNWVEIDCPNVEALVLNLSSLDYELPSFIAGMTKLKVLTVTNHGAFRARLRNFHCLSSLPNLKRIRLHNVFSTLLDLPQLRLGSLEKLSFFMCLFADVFYDCVDIDNSKEIDVSKALPSLQEIDIDYCYDLDELPYWVSGVVSLKTLSITNNIKLYELPEAIGNLSKLEVLRLFNCYRLCELPESIDRLSHLRFLDISNCSGLRKLPLEIGKLQKLKKISMKKCWIFELPDSVINLENLEVKCDEKTASLWGRLKPEMRNLSVHEEKTEPEL